MEPFKTGKRNEEEKIQTALESYLRAREWFVKSTHGNQFQSGFPDIYATHEKWGIRWIEVKYPHQFSFTAAQNRDFPKFSAHGTGIWILCAATDEEYQRLFKPCNWYEYFVCLQSGCHDIIKWRGGKFK